MVWVGALHYVCLHSSFILFRSYFTFMHSACAFFQSNLHCIQGIRFIKFFYSLGIDPMIKLVFELQGKLHVFYVEIDPISVEFTLFTCLKGAI